VATRKTISDSRDILHPAVANPEDASSPPLVLGLRSSKFHSRTKRRKTKQQQISASRLSLVIEDPASCQLKQRKSEFGQPWSNIWPLTFVCFTAPQLIFLYSPARRSDLVALRAAVFIRSKAYRKWDSEGLGPTSDGPDWVHPVFWLPWETVHWPSRGSGSDEVASLVIRSEAAEIDSCAWEINADSPTVRNWVDRLIVVRQWLYRLLISGMWRSVVW
jgi:hypothetical protein